MKPQIVPSANGFRCTYPMLAYKITYRPPWTAKAHAMVRLVLEAILEALIAKKYLDRSAPFNLFGDGNYDLQASFTLDPHTLQNVVTAISSII